MTSSRQEPLEGPLGPSCFLGSSVAKSQSLHLLLCCYSSSHWLVGPELQPSLSQPCSQGADSQGTAAGSMTQNVVTVNGVEVASTLSQPTHINIHIHQELALMQLLKAGSSLKQFLAGPWEMGPPKARLSYGQLAGGAIAAGAGVLVHEKRQSTLSGWVSGLLTLAGTATAIVAVVFCVNSITWENNGIDDCVQLPSPPTEISEYQFGKQNGYYRNSYYDPEDQEERCRAFMQTLRDLFLGTRILLLAVYSLKATASLVSLGLCLRSWRGQNSQPVDEERSGKMLLAEN
ncbi:LOW QUALITY PROTEIN: transmembrane protein 176B [Saccopteryx bilineata]|uniref:LOW QUALITY PROTEIN: transmembrane protein 176B n=1 Tax=Saccopteryx bilineata TaxID=59482 RepID=UPI0033900AD2